MDEHELNRLLREWKAPDAPPGLRPPRAPESRWRWLVTGSIRVPVPVALAALLAVLWIPTRFAAPPLLAPALETSTQPRPVRRSGELARYPLTGSLAGFDAVIVELHFAPGASAPEHRHPGPIVGYVVEGQMSFGINREADQVVPAGGTFFEPPGVLHSTFGSASADAPVRILAFLVVPSGSPLVDPV